MFWDDDEDDTTRKPVFGFMRHFDDDDEEDTDAKILRQLRDNGEVLRDIQKTLKKIERKQGI